MQSSGSSRRGHSVEVAANDPATVDDCATHYAKARHTRQAEASATKGQLGASPEPSRVSNTAGVQARAGGPGGDRAGGRGDAGAPPPGAQRGSSYSRRCS